MTSQILPSLFENPHLPPVSFTLNGVPARFRFLVARQSSETAGELAYAIEESDLYCRLAWSREPDFALATWQISLFCHGERTPVISDVCLLDLEMFAGSEQSLTLRGCSGGFIGWPKKGESRFPPGGLKPWEKVIDAGESFELDCGGCGKASAQQIPIWLLHNDAGGAWFGPEYSGTWALSLERQGKGCRARVSLPYLKFRLSQGEELALPAFSLATWQGDAFTGQQHLRRTIHEHFVAKTETGEPMTPPVLHQGLFGQEDYYTEDGIHREMQRAAELGCEYYVFNAHWFLDPPSEKDKTEEMPWGPRPVQVWMREMGDYTLSAKKFPSGPDALVKRAEKLGMKLGYWIDPRIGLESPEAERLEDMGTHADPEIAKSNPFLDPMIIDLGRSAGRRWMCDALERIYTEYHGRWVWLDINFYPRHSHWNYRETEDRQGLMELAYYQGLYQVFDEALERHPDLRVENCSNGGMMIDLGMLRRSHSLWVNDYVGFEGGHQEYDIDVNRNLRSGAGHWLPGALVVNSLYCPWEVTQSEELFDPIHYVSHFAGTFAFGQRVFCWKQADIDEAARYMAVYKQIRHLFAGDYEELFPLPQTRDAWDGWHFRDPQTGEGVLILFRLPDSQEQEQVVHPRGVDAGKTRFEVLLGQGNIHPENSALHVQLAETRYAVIRYFPV